MQWLPVFWRLLTAGAAGLMLFFSATAAGDDDRYLSGPDIRLDHAVDGDLAVAGGSVSIDGDVKNDLMAAGWIISLTGRVGDDLRAAGGDVSVEGSVGDGALLAGGRVRVTPDARIGGPMRVWGRDITIEGTADGGLEAMGENVTIAGAVNGDARVTARQLRLLPTARITGDLFYRSPKEAQIADGARVTGRVHYRPLEEFPAPPRVPAAAVGAGLALGVFAVVMVYYLLFPNVSLSAARTVGAAPWRSLAGGLALLVTVPFVIFLLMLTIVGVLLAFTLLALYFVLLLAGFLTGLIFSADWAIRRLAHREVSGKGAMLAALALILILLTLLQLVPVVGGLITFTLLLFGLGALALWLSQAYNRAAAD